MRGSRINLPVPPLTMKVCGTPFFGVMRTMYSVAPCRYSSTVSPFGSVLTATVGACSPLAARNDGASEGGMLLLGSGMDFDCTPASLMSGGGNPEPGGGGAECAVASTCDCWAEAASGSAANRTRTRASARVMAMLPSQALQDTPRR